MNAYLTTMRLGYSPQRLMIRLRPAAGSSSPEPGAVLRTSRELPARIEKFTATPESIKPGQSVTLHLGDRKSSQCDYRSGRRQGAAARHQDAVSQRDHHVYPDR